MNSAHKDGSVIMESEKRLALIHRLMELGVLPDQIGRAQIWGGPGSQRPCGTCGEPIVVSAVEYELDIDGRTIVLCVPCYLAWRAQPTGA